MKNTCVIAAASTTSIGLAASVKATSRDLKDALDAVLAGKKVVNAETEVDGCPITFAKERKPREVTFAENVAPVLQKHCWSCHHTGGSAPFADDVQASVRTRESIAEVITDQRMPPWFASHEFGPFVNRRALSDDESGDAARLGPGRCRAGNVQKTPALLRPPTMAHRLAGFD